MSHFLQDNYFVGFAFWIVLVAMIASTVFFFMKGWQLKKSGVFQ